MASVSYFFFLYQSPSSSLCSVFDSISSNIDEVLSINPSTVFDFGDFNFHHKNWLTYSSGTDRLGELCYNFSISNDLTQMVNFPTRIPDCDSHSPILLDLFISSDASICSTMAFPPLGNSDHVVVNFVSGVRLELMYISLISAQASFISMVFSCLCCCHSSYKSLSSFASKRKIF